MGEFFGAHVTVDVILDGIPTYLTGFDTSHM